jgi:type II secretory pathway pseudopilin PulG
MTKTALSKIGKYLREVSVVVIGIAITVSVGLLVNYINEKKDQKQYLTAIQLELEQNAKYFEAYAKWLQKSVNYAEYLKSNNYKNLSQDSLYYYATSYSVDYWFENEAGEIGYGCGYMNINPLTDCFTTYAFEMYKSSGAMRQIDKELLRYIWEIYYRIEGEKNGLKDFFQLKKDEAVKELQLSAEGKTIDVPMRVFYSSSVPIEMQSHCLHVSKTIKAVLEILEKANR